MKVAIILSCLAVAVLAVPVDKSAYEKPEYNEVQSAEHQELAAKEQPEQHMPKYEEPADKSVYPYVVSKAFPYDYRGFPYINNEFPHGYPAPKQAYYAPYPYNAPYPFAGSPAYHQAPAAYAPAVHHAPAAYAPALHHAPAVHHAPVEPAYKAPVHQAPVKDVAKPKYDSMKYYGKYSKGCVGDGIYYNNLESFILCSNGNAYEQKCAPGTKNQGADSYKYGSNYSFNDLCGINLVDTGYGPSNVVY